MYVGGVVEVKVEGWVLEARAWGDAEASKEQEEVLTQAGVHGQGSSNLSALMLAVRQRKTGMVEKLLAAGAKAGTTNEVH